MFRKDPGEIAIVMDTLATTIDGEPYLFMTKSHLFPHLDMVMVTTGIAQLGNRWAIFLQDHILARDAEMLDLYTPDVLRALWAELDAEDDLGGKSATVYHFGRSEATNQYVGFAYRSEKNFFSDPIPDGFGVKPAPLNRNELVEPASLDEWIAMATRIRKEQEALPAAQRLYIGGALVLTVLTQGVATTTVIHRFDDYDATWNSMNDRING
jgi:hypothetical protein